eukprot:270092-Rhodomonas_salina.5
MARRKRSSRPGLSVGFSASGTGSARGSSTDSHGASASAGASVSTDKKSGLARASGHQSTSRLLSVQLSTAGQNQAPRLLSLTFLIRELHKRGLDPVQLLTSAITIPSDPYHNESFLQGANLLRFLDTSKNGVQAEVYFRMCARRIPPGLVMKDRDVFDLSAKFPLAIKALQLGISANDLMIDAAQAGGLYGRADGLIRNRDGLFEPLEVKGATEKNGECLESQYSMHQVRHSA